MQNLLRVALDVGVQMSRKDLSVFRELTVTIMWIFLLIWRRETAIVMCVGVKRAESCRGVQQPSVPLAMGRILSVDGFVLVSVGGRV